LINDDLNDLCNKALFCNPFIGLISSQAKTPDASLVTHRCPSGTIWVTSPLLHVSIIHPGALSSGTSEQVSSVDADAPFGANAMDARSIGMMKSISSFSLLFSF
jgi:hypothetical protein